MKLQTIAVVGASLAGLRAVETLRGDGYAGRIVWMVAVACLAYDRPPLSKQLLRGEWEPEKIALRRHSYDELELDMRLGVRATALDLAARRVELDLGGGVAYDGLLIATGATPRALPNPANLSGIHLLRSLDDALALREAFRKTPRVCVVGAGFIGAEVAASAREIGLDVTMVDPLPAPCQRGVGVLVGRVLASVHADHGVDVRLGVGVDGFEGAERVERVRLSDGSAVEADVVVVGIGVSPETAWLESSGLELSDGVVCDESCATAAPGVVAAGDVARWHNPLYGESMRVDHWTNAVEQGMHAARRLLAGDASAGPFAAVPTFWSDQYDLRIQSAGHVSGQEEVVVVKGSFEQRRFVALYGRDDRLVGALALNRARDLIPYRRLIAERASWPDALAAARAEA